MQIIDPLTDPRWTGFVERHPGACAFHATGWLRALRESYGYEALAVTSSPPDQELTDALPLCRIQSWLTGNRLVSLPFTDHCQPLADTAETTKGLIAFAAETVRKNEKFIEFRPAQGHSFELLNADHCSASYFFHWLDLSPPLETIFSRLHKDSIQRKIRRAEREGLRYEEGCSLEVLDKFYALLIRTRRRHALPPQPIRWFRKLLECMSDSVQIRVALKDQVPIAAILSLHHRNSIIYKYGCSDERYHAAGSMPALFWRMIEDAKSRSIPLLDFGRSDLDNPGLIRFKDQWGTVRAELNYYRFPAPSKKRAKSSRFRHSAESLVSYLPDRVLQGAGSLIYRHIG